MHLASQPAAAAARSSAVVSEQYGDLMQINLSLAHCVGEDLRMGAGIALEFREKFKRVPELLNQCVKQGGVAVLKEKGRYIYYLVTKKLSTDKPTLKTLAESLTKLKEHMLGNGVKKVAMPRIGCGLDQLKWFDVRQMLEEIFGGTDISITVYTYDKAREQMSQSSSKHRNQLCKIVTVPKSLIEIEPYTIILYIGSEDGGITEEMSVLAKKFNILPRYKDEEKTVGKVFCDYYMSYSYALYCLVIKKRRDDPFNFVHFDSCLRQVNGANNKLAAKKQNYNYVAMQRIRDETDDNNLNGKIINILQNSLDNVEIYICE